jgi:hypothetical protein
MEVSGQLHTPVTLLPGKSPWYTLDKRLGGPQNVPGQMGTRIAQRCTTELSWLLSALELYLVYGFIAMTNEPLELGL